MSLEPRYPLCEQAGRMRPDVVWFGEMPYQMDRILAALADSDPFISIGISGNVHSAAGLVREVRAANARRIELNLEAEHGPAKGIVPVFVERLPGGSPR